MRRIALLVCLLSAYSLGQGGAATGIPTITNTRGEPVPYATVAVCVGYPGSVPSTPCGTSTLATIATDLTLTTSCTNSLTPPGPISGTGCSNPGKSDGLGNIVAFATPGLYWCQYSGGSIIQPVVVPCFFANGSGGGIPFACASAVNGSIVGMTSPTTSSCDPNGITDFIGHWTSQSYRATGTHNGTVELTGGLADPTNPPDTNSVAFLAPLTVPTPYYVRPPASAGTVGQLLNLATQVISTNGTIDALGWLNAVTTINGIPCNLGSTCSITVGGTVEFQTNSVDNANCTAGACPLQNLVAGPNITLTNTSGGNVTIAASGSAAPQASNPSAPTLTTNGTPGAASVSYVVQGCEDGPTCADHSAPSATATIGTANATITGVNSVNLKAYADTLYGYRCFNIYRTAGGPSQGKIASCADKQFIDTGAAGDGTSPVAGNATVLDANGVGDPVHSCNKVPWAPWLLDGLPCTPNADSNELAPTFGVPGDGNNPYWFWVNQNSATASWTNGMLVINSPDRAGENLNLLCHTISASTPYTYTTVVSFGNTASGAATGAVITAGVAFRESATNKITTLGQYAQNENHPGDYMLGKWNNSFTAPTFSPQGITFTAPNPAYFQAKNDGTNVIYRISADGINYTQVLSETKTTFFTTGPDQFCVGLSALSGASTISVDYERQN